MSEQEPTAGSGAARLTATTTRDRILQAASRLLAEGGRDAVSTRAVCASAGVQAPVIYRHFGDKRGLLDAVAAVGFDSYLKSYAQEQAIDDPLEDLRRGWDANVGFGLTNPYLFALVYGDPSRYPTSPTAAAARAVVEDKVHRVAQSGRLRVSENMAVDLLLAACSGVTLALIATPSDRQDHDLARVAREAVIAVICPLPHPSPEQDDFLQAVRTVRAGLDEVTPLSPGEHTLFGELLDRASTPAAPGC